MDLSAHAREVLRLLHVKEDGIVYVPKQVVEQQWSPESRAAFRELREAGIAEEITVYRLSTRSEESR